MSQPEIALLAIAAALFGIIAAHRLTLWRNRNESIRSAANAFKAEFISEIANIRNGDADFGTFTGAFQKHKVAVDAVMPILPKRHQRKLQKAWDEYYGKGSDIDTETFIAGSSCHHELFPEFKKRFNTLHSCLDDLL